jgi:hypothetical protein
MASNLLLKKMDLDPGECDACVSGAACLDHDVSGAYTVLGTHFLS